MKQFMLLIAIALVLKLAWSTFGGSRYSREQIAAIAASVNADDVTMYTITECPYCTEAMLWLTEHDLAYRECNTEVDERCATEFRRLGGVAVPFFVVRGMPMQGFDADRILEQIANR